MGVIYCATNKINGKKYIGQTIYSMENRRKEHEKAAINKVNHPFYDSIRKHGADNFEWVILKDGIDERDTLNVYEIAMIRKHKSLYPGGYNLREGGSDGGFPQEVKDRLSRSNKEAWQDPEVRQKYLDALLKSNDQRALSVQKSWQDPLIREKKIISIKKSVTSEMRIANSERMKGKRPSQQTIEKIRKTLEKHYAEKSLEPKLPISQEEHELRSERAKRGWLRRKSEAPRESAEEREKWNKKRRDNRKAKKCLSQMPGGFCL